MRRFLFGIVVAAAAALVPTWATAGNQEVAEQIAAALRDSGQLHGYRIGVKYQDGTAWLKGQVATRDEMGAAMQLVFNVPGVTRVVNHLTARSEQPTEQAAEQPVESRVAQTPLQASNGAVSGEQRLPAPARERSQPNAREIVPAQTERLTTRFEPVSEPRVEMTGLEEPTVARAERAAEPQVETVGVDEPTVAFAKPAAEPRMKAMRLEKPSLAPVRRAAESRVERTALEEPTLAPQKEDVSVPATTPRAPQPMPAAYAQPPLPIARANGAAMPQAPMAIPTGAAPARYDQPNLPNYAWPSYSPYPNYASLTYPKQYSPTAWPYIGPFYPYPQVPLGWRKVTLEWHDGWWALDFDDGTAKGPFSGLFRPARRRY